MSPVLRIVTRTSQLAMWQAEFVKAALIQQYPHLCVEIIGIKTYADQWQDVPLYKMGGKSLFVKELEAMLLENQADIAVHSLKDMPAELPEGLQLGAILKREDPRDAWLCPSGKSLMALPAGAVVGTSSLRRQVQISALRSDLNIVPLRGNVDTRWRKCLSGEFDAIVLALAGLVRLNLAMEHRVGIDLQMMLPAVGQGALGIECRQSDAKTLSYLASLNDPTTSACVQAERKMNAYLGGNCQVPVAGFATFENKQLVLKGLVGDPETAQLLQATAKGTNPDQIGDSVAKALIAQGADKIIEKLTPS